MHEDSPAGARTALTRADDARRRVRSASRWFPLYLLLTGVWATVTITVLESVFPVGPESRFWLLAAFTVYGALQWWSSRQDVHPAGAHRRVTVATVVWFGTYLLLLGPVVRWQAGTSLAWWSLAAVVLASPFYVAAWREWRRR